MKTDRPRWQIAQAYEKNWWADRNNILDLEFYERFAQDLMDFCKESIQLNQHTRILEIGSGASGILTHIKISDHRYALDPLESFYSSVEKFSTHRDKFVKYLAAKGEEIPIKANTIDLIIIDNVLDHCDNPNRVINEMKRLIKTGGIIYFKQNTYHSWGKLIRQIMEKFLIDKGHPFTFSKKDLSKLLSTNGFEVLKSKRTGYLLYFKRELLSNSWIDKIKAALFVTRDKVTYLLQVQ